MECLRQRRGKNQQPFVRTLRTNAANSRARHSCVGYIRILTSPTPLSFYHQYSVQILLCPMDVLKFSKVNEVNSSSKERVFAVLFIPNNVNSSHTFIVLNILNSWETDLQKLIDFLLNSNYLNVNFLYYMYTCCCTKMK